jgi:putative restriction endonuclease
LDREVWEQFSSDPEAIGFESEIATARVRGTPLEISQVVEWEHLEGLDREALTKVRVNQGLFRSIIVAGYRCECCVCTLPIQSLLVAAHIVPWSVDNSHRMNPRNGLCLCVLHDRAYDRGLFEISSDYIVHLRSDVRKYHDNTSVQNALLHFDGKPITLPDRWHPDTALLERHAILFRDVMI